MRRSTRVPLACASSLGDDTGGGGEHVGPFGEGFIGRDEDRHGEVPAGDDLEEEVGISVVVVEVSDLVRTDEDDIGGVVDEGQREELLDEGAVDTIGPGPVEVGDGLEGADACVGEAAFEGAALAFAVLDVDDALDPGLGEHGVVLGGEAVECDLAQALSHGVGISRWCLVHCCRLDVYRRRWSRAGGRSRRGRGGAPRGCAAAGRRAGQARAAGACRSLCAAGR